MFLSRANDLDFDKNIGLWDLFLDKLKNEWIRPRPKDMSRLFNRTKSLSLSLGYRKCLTLESVRALSLACVHGKVLVTAENDSQDYTVSAKNEVTLRNRGLVVVQGFAPESKIRLWWE